MKESEANRGAVPKSDASGISSDASGAVTDVATATAPPVAASSSIGVMMPDDHFQEPPLVETSTLDASAILRDSELANHCRAAGSALTSLTIEDPLLEHGTRALAAFDALSPTIAEADVDIAGLLGDARAELLDAYMASMAGRTQVAFVLLRGVMEGVFSALFYRQQSMSLNLWASGASFHMVHQFLNDKHEFYMYYRRLFDDERFLADHPGVKFKKVIDEAVDIYDMLSASVHKKSPSSRAKVSQDYRIAVERVFRISVCLLEREQDLPHITFPSPASFARYEAEATMARQKKGAGGERRA